MTKTISVFNNKGGVGKTTIIWNLAVALADKNKNVLLIDFDPQCNLSIACVGAKEFSEVLNDTEENPFGKTIKSFALPYIQQNSRGEVFTAEPKCKTDRGVFHIIPGDFWLNTFSDILNVGTDVISGAGLYRFTIPSVITEIASNKNDISYDYVLIDLPPSFNTLVRSALYCSDYFLVPCTPDLFSAYCIGLIGEMLPSFIRDWEQGKERYLSTNPRDNIISKKGQPKFGGWIYNSFDTRTKKSDGIKREVGADAVLHNSISDAVKNKLIPGLNGIKNYNAIPSFVDQEPIGKIEDLNVMAPDSIFQNIPIRYLMRHRPTNSLRGRYKWAQNQIDLMEEMSDEYNKMSDYIIKNF